MERRQHERFVLEAALNVLWKDSEGAPQQAKGLARDISASGVFVFADEVPPVRTDVEIEVLISSVLARSRLVIQGAGQVIRVEAGPTVRERAAGFAAVISGFRLRNEKGEVLE
jgi:PilZ domain